MKGCELLERQVAQRTGGSALVVDLLLGNTIVRYNLHPLPAASLVTHILCSDAKELHFESQLMPYGEHISGLT